MLARIIPLKPERIYNVIFEDTFNADVADHPRADDLIDETDSDLGILERYLPREKITKVHSDKGIDIWRYKPGTDKALRVLYWPDGKDRHVLMTIPRSTDYRRTDLDTAVHRALSAKAAKSES